MVLDIFIACGKYISCRSWLWDILFIFDKTTPGRFFYQYNVRVVYRWNFSDFLFGVNRSLLVNMCQNPNAKCRECWPCKWKQTAVNKEWCKKPKRWKDDAKTHNYVEKIWENITLKIILTCIKFINISSKQ